MTIAVPGSPAEFVELPSITFRWAPSPPFSFENWLASFTHWNGRAVVDVTLDCYGSANPFDDQGDNFQDAFTLMQPGLDHVADLDNA